MKYIRSHKEMIFWAVVLVLFGAVCYAWGGTVTTSTSIKGYDIAKGYTIYATTISPTTASGEVIGVSAVASPGYNVAGKRIKVVAYELIAYGDVNVKFQSGGTDDITGSTLWYLTQNSGLMKPISIIHNQPIVYMQSGVGASLSINLSTPAYVSGSLWYYME